MKRFKNWFLKFLPSRSLVEIGGFVKVYKKDVLTGEVSFLGSFCNVTTTNYKTRVLNRILSGTATDNISPLTMEIGTGVSTASSADTSLQTLLLSKTFNNVPKVSGSQIVYEIKLSPTEANTLITEVGLKTGDGLLVSRVNVSINKTSQDIIILQFTKSVI